MTGAGDLSLAAVTAAVGAPAGCWVDACLPVCHSLVEARPDLGATVVEGKWTGAVAPGSHFRWLVDELGVTALHHCWLAMPDGRVLDPTRWVYEAVKPYVYLGPADHYRPEPWKWGR